MTERVKVNTVEASLVVTFACLNKSIAEFMEFCCLLAKMQGKRERDLIEVQMVLG